MAGMVREFFVLRIIAYDVLVDAAVETTIAIGVLDGEELVVNGDRHSVCSDETVVSSSSAEINKCHYYTNVFQ